MAGPEEQDPLAILDLHLAQLRGEVATLRLIMENSIAGSLIDSATDPVAAAGEYFAGLSRQASRRREPNATPHIEAAVYAADDALERLHRAVVARIKEHFK
jgi:hypothetical protein